MSSRSSNLSEFDKPFETFVALLSRVDGVHCRIESETALQGTSEIVDAIRLPIKVKAVLTTLPEK
jgi:hypothetical protein